jgi:nicotinamidase-related amidase
MDSALLVIDMLNAYDFEDADKVAASASDAVPRIAELIERARGDDVPLIYVNDNYGDWNSSIEELVERALEGNHPELVEPIRPDGEEWFVIKARHTVFYGTPLEYLLQAQGIDRLVLTGQVTEQCILYSALDAYVRHIEVAVARDAVAHIYEELAEASLAMMERNMSAQIAPGAEIDLQP